MTARSPTLSEEIRARMHLQHPCWKSLMAAHPELSASTFWRRVKAEKDKAKAEKSQSRRDLRDPFASAGRRKDMTRLYLDLDIRSQEIECAELVNRIRDSQFRNGSFGTPYWADQSVGLRVEFARRAVRLKGVMSRIEAAIAWETTLLKAARAASPSFANSLNAEKISLFEEKELFAFRELVSILGDSLQEVPPGVTPAVLRRALKARQRALDPLVRLAGEMFDVTYAERFGMLLHAKIMALPEWETSDIAMACAGELHALSHWLEDGKSKGRPRPEKVKWGRAEVCAQSASSGS